jgi:hypothetical protein
VGIIALLLLDDDLCQPAASAADADEPASRPNWLWLHCKPLGAQSRQTIRLPMPENRIGNPFILVKHEHLV